MQETIQDGKTESLDIRKRKLEKLMPKKMSGRLTVKNTKKGQQSDMVWISSKLEEAEWKPLVGI